MNILCIGGPNDGEWHEWNIAKGRPHLNIKSQPPYKVYTTFAEQLFHNPADHYDLYTTYERYEIRIHNEPSLWFAVPCPSNATLHDAIRALMDGYRRPR